MQSLSTLESGEAERILTGNNKLIYTHGSEFNPQKHFRKCFGTDWEKFWNMSSSHEYQVVELSLELRSSDSLDLRFYHIVRKFWKVGRDFLLSYWKFRRKFTSSLTAKLEVTPTTLAKFRTREQTAYFWLCGMKTPLYTLLCHCNMRVAITYNNGKTGTVVL